LVVDKPSNAPERVPAMKQEAAEPSAPQVAPATPTENAPTEAAPVAEAPAQATSEANTNTVPAKEDEDSKSAKEVAATPEKPVEQSAPVVVESNKKVKESTKKSVKAPAADKSAEAQVEKPKTAKAAPAHERAPKAGAASDEPKEPEVPSGGSYESYLARAQAALSNGQLDAARANFERALEESPSSGEATVGLGDVARKQGNAQLAIRYYYAAARRGAKIAYLRMGEVYEKQNRLDDAISAYHTYLVRDPQGSFATQAQTRLDALLAQEREQQQSSTTETPNDAPPPAPATDKPAEPPKDAPKPESNAGSDAPSSTT
jgi:tetratricopeptide (TPR) repeat protein